MRRGNWTRKNKVKKSAHALIDAVAIFVPSRFIEIHRKSESWAWFEQKGVSCNKERVERTSQSTTYTND